jgi:signal transduction histidine kinase
MSSPFADRLSKFFSPMRQDFVLERYGVGLATAVLAILLRWLLDPVLGHVAFYVTIYAAVAYCAVTCGLGPSTLSALVGFCGVFYWFVDPRHSLSLNRPEFHSSVGFFLVCFALIALGETNRRKQLRLNQTVAALTSEASERHRAETDLQQAHSELDHRVHSRTAQLTEALARLESEINVRKQAENQLRQLSLRIMNLQDEERRRIARDLHDTAGQTLAAIKMISATIQQIAADEPKILDLLAELNHFADEALQEIRTTSYLLHPPLLDESGFASAARWFVEGFARRSGIQAECSIPENLDRPPRNYELVMFRVLQEALTNVHRHSEATAARVSLQTDAGLICLNVTDNGRGIPAQRLEQLNDASTGVGINGMKERLHELGGHLEIQSGATGTTVTVVLPAHKTSSVSAANHHTTSAA